MDWILCTRDRLPTVKDADQWGDVLVCYNDGSQHVREWGSLHAKGRVQPVYWARLPKPPIERPTA